MISHTTDKAVAVLALGLVVLLCSCENSVNPFIEADRYYSIYGYLDTASDTQFVRVVPLRKTIGAIESRDVDAAVSTMALEDDRTIVWRDSVIDMSDGSVAHVFYAAFRPIPEWTYQIDVLRSDGIEATATTTVPPSVAASVSPPRIIPGGLSQTVTWSNVDFPPFRVEVWYRFANNRPNRPFREAILAYSDVGRRTGDDWSVSVPLTRDRKLVTELLGLPPEMLSISAIGMRLTMTDERWRPPGGIFDVNVLVQPEVFTNVEHGFGFFGSVNHYAFEWTLDPDTIEQLGYDLGG